MKLFEKNEKASMNQFNNQFIRNEVILLTGTYFVLCRQCNGPLSLNLTYG